MEPIQFIHTYNPNTSYPNTTTWSVWQDETGQCWVSFTGKQVKVDADALTGWLYYESGHSIQSDVVDKIAELQEQIDELVEDNKSNFVDFMENTFGVDVR